MLFFNLIQFSKSEAFAGEALVIGEISFLILLSLVWTSDIFSHLTLETSIFIEDSPGNKHSRLANQLQIILYTFTTFSLIQPIKCTDLRLWEEYPFHASDFDWSSNQTTIQGLGWLKIPAYAFWESISFHFNQNKNQRSDLLNPTGRQEMLSFKLDQYTDKPRSLFTFSLDNLKVRFVLTFEIDLSISFKPQQQM